MNVKERIEQLRKLSVQTGSLACLGCGQEHGCSVHGCAILRGAAEDLEELSGKIGELERQVDWWKEQNFKVCYDKSELSGKIERLEKQLGEAELNRPIELSGKGAKNFCLAAELSKTKQELAEAKAQKERLTPYDVCAYNPPSSFDGKPCSFCPAERK